MMNLSKRNGTNGKKQSQLWDFDHVQCTKEVLLSHLQTSEGGLSEQEAKRRLEEFGLNEPTAHKKTSILWQLGSKFLNPLVIALLLIASVTLFLRENIDALIVSTMAVLSVVLAFVQEYRASRAADKLKALVRTTATVWRNGKSREIGIKEIVPGDIIDLFAGDMIPADIRILSCKDFFLNQSALTGEAYPVEKFPSPPSSSSEQAFSNMAFMGSSVVSGTALAVAVKTGGATQFGELYQKLSTMTVATAFDRGIRQFTVLMIKATVVLVSCIFAIIALRHGDLLEAFLFSLGVAVGLTPEMLPMIVTITLSQGAIALSKKQAIVKRLSSIQNFGAMDVLCTDKTGTLTIDKIVLEKHCDVRGVEDEDVLRYAYINSYYQTGLRNILDKAILKHEKLIVTQHEKIDEIPFDFSRKIMSVVVTMNGSYTLIAKGSPSEIFKRIDRYEWQGKIYAADPEMIDDLQQHYHALGAEGFRVLAVAYKEFADKKLVYSKDDETHLILKGYVAFLDPPKPTAKEAIGALKKLGITLKVLTGDNEFVTKKICSDVGLDGHGVVTSTMVDRASDDELRALVESANVFTGLFPAQKERVIRALHGNGHVVGYLGDGINDAPALKVSDVGISVNNAVDIAKESADIILLKKSLMVLRDGVLGGRKTFGNIIKYIKMNASSNFGNMVSMTGASIFLPFLPMLPMQILLNNLMYDLSQMTIPLDNVDDEYLANPRPWNVHYIKKFMLIVGPISSIFDFVMFWALLFFFHAGPEPFHTGWFVESLCTQILVVYIIRTGGAPFAANPPHPWLVVSTLSVAAVGLLLPFSPIASLLGFVPLPVSYFFVLALVAGCYFSLVYRVKNWFIRKYGMM
jgi:Mg2+-importing ATPase